MAYFLVDENQKRGSPHGHSVMYVRGVTPDSVREFLKVPENQNHLIAWLESVVRECIPAAAPLRAGPTGGYRCPDPDDPEFEVNFPRVAMDVVKSTNIHRHTATCYKYLKPGQEKICRMEYGRKLNPTTTVDCETGDIHRVCMIIRCESVVFSLTTPIYHLG